MQFICTMGKWIVVLRVSKFQEIVYTRTLHTLNLKRFITNISIIILTCLNVHVQGEVGTTTSFINTVKSTLRDGWRQPLDIAYKCMNWTYFIANIDKKVGHKFLKLRTSKHIKCMILCTKSSKWACCWHGHQHCESVSQRGTDTISA
jgi:hypothetical protein